MKTCHKIAATFLSFGILIGTACAQENKQAELSKRLTEDETQYSGYGRKMRQNPRYDDYCGESPCSQYRRVSRMSHHDRKMLRQQVTEAEKTLYPRPHH